MDSYGDGRLKRKCSMQHCGEANSQSNLQSGSGSGNVKPSQLVWPGLHFSKDNVA